MPDLTVAAPETFRPQGPRVVAYGVAVLLLAVTAVIGFALPPDIRATFDAGQLATLGACILAVLVGLWGVARSYVRVDDDGVEVLNAYKRHRIAWDDLAGISFKAGAPWPTLVTKDDDRVIVFALQGTDGGYAKAGVAAIRGHLP